MALSSVTITANLADMLGTDFDTRRTKVWVSTNVPGDTVIDTVGNAIRLGTGTATLGTDGALSLSVWIPGTGSNPASWQTSIHVDYADPGTRTRVVRTFGPFTITAGADLADLVTEQEVPPEYATTLTALLDALADAADASADAAASSASAAAVSAALAEDVSGIDGLQDMVDLISERSALLATAGQTPEEEPVSSGTAAVGSLDRAARADHVHPSDGMFWVWGSGLDGDLDFDGSTTVTLPDGTAIVPSSSVYTLVQPLAGRDVVVRNGVTLKMGQGCYLRARSLTCPSGSAVIHADGNAGAANGTAGAARAAVFAPATGAGGAGNTGAGSTGSYTAANDQWHAGNAGVGGLGSSGAGGAVAGGLILNNGQLPLVSRDPMTQMFGQFHSLMGGSGTGVMGLLSGSNGGGGGGDGTNKGGGGGSGGGILIVAARTIAGNITMRARGGAGGSPATGNCGGGGGGGGGFVFINTLNADDYSGPTVTAAHLAPGGVGGTKVGTGVNGSAGGNGYAYLNVWA